MARQKIPPVLSYPSFLQPSVAALAIIRGAPASGKSTYVSSLADPDDIVIDLDSIIVRLGGEPRSDDIAVRIAGLIERNKLLASLADSENLGRRAWFITGAPAAWQRQHWIDSLAPAAVVLVDTDKATCLQRVTADPARDARRTSQNEAINRWFDRYESSEADLVVDGASPLIRLSALIQTASPLIAAI